MVSGGKMNNSGLMKYLYILIFCVNIMNNAKFSILTDDIP